MRLNLDLLREILKDVADHDGAYDLSCNNLVYDDLPRNLINYHIHLLVNEGYLKAIDASDKDGYDYLAIELTMRGQLFLEKIERSTVWNKTKEMISNGASVTTIASIEALAVQVIQNFF